ncbi:hypothetical protein RRG08_053141 [Elysia crispata]|uniref:Uncharacterized protein n=1 Tax=Elysia crispata TaxID=231223 RepID=A0AAE0YUD9_9GAST|nr:hypothetical protein RRG08_053141 [Elysia crispata]
MSDVPALSSERIFNRCLYRLAEHGSSQSFLEQLPPTRPHGSHLYGHILTRDHQSSKNKLGSPLYVILPATGSIWYRKSFNFSGVELNCSVTQWEFCINMIKNPKDLSCECSRRKLIGPRVFYTFYWYFLTVTDDYHERNFSASLDDEGLVSRLMEVVKFSSMPAVSQIFCKDTQKSFSWTFTPSSPLIKSFFQVAAVEWFNKVHSTPPRSQLIARVQYDTRRTPLVVITSLYQNKVAVIEDGRLGHFTLAILRTLTQQKTTVQVVVSFNRTRYDYAMAHLLDENQKQIQRLYPTTTKTATKISTTTNTSTSKSTNKTQLLRSSTSALKYDIGAKNFAELSGEIEIRMLAAPYRRIRAMLEWRRTVSGSDMIMCSVLRGFMGSPPVNLTLTSKTIGNDEHVTQLISLQGVARIRYIPLYVKRRVFHCRLSGPSMQCVKPTDPVAQQVTENFTDVSISSFLASMDAYFVMYSVQSFIILIVILSTLSNVMQHLQLLASRKKKAIEFIQHELETMRPRDSRRTHVRSESAP